MTNTVFVYISAEEISVYKFKKYAIENAKKEMNERSTCKFQKEDADYICMAEDCGCDYVITILKKEIKLK